MSSQYKPKATVRSSRDNRVEPSELTPLNQNISANYQPRENLEAQTTRTMDDGTKRVLTKIVIDLVLLCCGE